MSEDHDTKHIMQSLASNVALTVIKLGAALYTGSGALLAEAIHTGADSSNQVLLLIGVSRSRKAPDARHPLGHGRELYFWSFMVALLLFSAGGLVSIYEGVHKYGSPEPITNAWVGFVVLGATLLLEIVVTGANVKQLNEKRGRAGFFEYVKLSKDSDFIVVFGENVAALIGSLLALGAYTMSWRTGDGRFDAAGSVLVGVVLVAVAVFLTTEVKSLLIGESADPTIDAAATMLAIEDPLVDKVSNVITIQQGPGQVLVALKVTCAPHLSAADVSRMINGFEARLRERCPQAKWIFVEPDLGDGRPSEHDVGVVRANDE